jgi:hypothetical protein
MSTNTKSIKPALRLPRRIPGSIVTVLIVVGCFVGLKAIPSLLWPARYKSLVQDEGFRGGHYTVGINERMVAKDAGAILFSTLKKWRYDREAPTPPPEALVETDKKPAKITGFMYPLQSGSRISTFCLLRSTQTCCYGPKPQFNQFVLIEMDHRVPFERLRPVEVAGTFYVEPRPEDGYIYRMEGKKVTVPD